MNILLSWLVLSLAVWLAAVLLPGVHVRSLGSAVLVAAIFGVLNVLVGWLFFTVIGIGTLGLGFLLSFITRWIVNGILLKIVDAFTTRLKIDSFGWALLAALIISAVGTLAEWVIT